MPFGQLFEQSRSAQSGSQLMQLPAELRIMILRDTLKKSDITRTAVEYARHISRGHPLNVDPTMPTGEDFQHNI